MLNEAAAPNPDIELISALAISALVLYVRAHTGGSARQAPTTILKQVVASMSTGEQQLHRKFTAYRNKGFIRSENAFEANLVGLSCRTDDEGRRIPKKVAAFHMQVAAITAEEARDLSALAYTVHAKFRDEVEKERAKVFALAERLSEQELTSLENLIYPIDSLWVAPEKRRSRT